MSSVVVVDDGRGPGWAQKSIELLSVEELLEASGVSLEDVEFMIANKWIPNRSVGGVGFFLRGDVPKVARLAIDVREHRAKAKAKAEKAKAEKAKAESDKKLKDKDDRYAESWEVVLNVDGGVILPRDMSIASKHFAKIRNAYSLEEMMGRILLPKTLIHSFISVGLLPKYIHDLMRSGRLDMGGKGSSPYQYGAISIAHFNQASNSNSTTIVSGPRLEKYAREVFRIRFVDPGPKGWVKRTVNIKAIWADLAESWSGVHHNLVDVYTGPKRPSRGQRKLSDSVVTRSGMLLTDLSKKLGQDVYKLVRTIPVEDLIVRKDVVAKLLDAKGGKGE